MAEEVPISDVLCNATEYLCKLGSNLRSRSENLKQNRITKDKLRNAHAVRKAASKVLLICELSKKSLENVENSVKKVLTIVDASRCSPSVGAKTTNVSPGRQSTIKEYFYFEHEAYKLRISKKILLKHYTSLKVLAKSMPATMLDKYPVYYNCKLYQKRKKTKDSVNKNEDVIEESSITVMKHSEKNENSGSDSQKTNNVNKDVVSEEESDVVSKIPKEEIFKKSHTNKKTRSDSENEGVMKSIPNNSKKSEAESNQNETLLKKDSGPEKKLNNELQNLNDVNKDIENLVSHTDKPIEMDKDKSKKKKIDVECKTSTLSRDQSESSLEPELIREKVAEEENKPTEEKDSELRIKYNTEKSRKSKSVRFLDESSESSLKESEEGNDSKKIKLAKESECDDVVDLLDDDCLKSSKETEKCHEVTEKTEHNKDDGSVSGHKPMIKLVSLNKLLKPDVIQKLDGNTGNKVLKQTSIKTYRGKITKDGGYFLENRKELNSFKPKKLSIIVRRLPKFSDIFLCQYGLKQIVQNGKIVYKKGSKAVTNSDNLKLDVNVNKFRKKSKDITDDDADKVQKKLDKGVAETKNALLNSDSDSSETLTNTSKTEPSETTRKDSVSKTKVTLLDSDSDSSNSKIKTKSKKDALSKTKHALLDSDSDSSNNKNKTKSSKKDASPKSEHTLLDSDSDSSNSKNKTKSSKKDSLSKTKNALLHSDSDSSNSKNKTKPPKKDAPSKTKRALLDSDDSSYSKNKTKSSNKDGSSKPKQSVLDSDSDNSNSKINTKSSEKDALSKTKLALLDSDSDSSNSKNKTKSPEKDASSKPKQPVFDSDSDNSNSKNRTKSSRKDASSKSEPAVLDSDSDSSNSKNKTKSPKKDALSKSKHALLDSDSDSSNSKNKTKPTKKDASSKSKQAVLDSHSDSSNSKNKPESIQKDSLSKCKNSLLNSDNPDSKQESESAKMHNDSDGTDCKKKTKTAKTTSLLKSKTALFDSDSDSAGSKHNRETIRKHSLSETKTALVSSDSNNSDAKTEISKTKTALLNSDSDNSDSKRKSKTPEKDSVSKSKTALLDSDSDCSGSKKKTDASITPKISETKNALHNSDSDSSDCNTKSKNDSLSVRPVSENTNNLDKSDKETNESSGLVKDNLSNNGKGNNIDADESKSLKSVELPQTPESKKQNKDQTTPRSKRKMIMESMQAKKMLLTYSSSDTDDEHLKNTLKDVRNSLLNVSSSSDDEIDVKKIVQANRRQLVTPSDSDNSLKKSKERKKKKKGLSKETEASKESSISQFDGTNDEQSDTSSSQMGRSKTKVASSSNQSSENVDSNDIEINRLTDLSSLNRRRRRDPGAKASSRSTRRMPKAPLIEEALGPDSSDAVSDAESDVGDVEELPAVPIQDLNGDGINHLAKEDLLAQSDSSSSQNDKENGSEEDKKDDTDEEADKVKSIRRKANAISSDSEAGSSRRKAERMSDFEDSEADSEPRKKTKRKKKGSDSDASLSSNDGSKKKRRRIKQVNDSEGSGSDSENEGKNKHGRKNIRKVMSKDQLEEATKKAARREKERVARIAERQKLYNNLEFDESGKPDEVVLEKVVLDFDPETKEPLIEVDRGLVKKLKPHQANGIKFMWNACFESVKRIKKDRGSGCILAHCMGLGKTLQVVSLTHTLLTHGSLTGVRRVLVVCPLSTVLNWVNEFNMWLKHSLADYEVDVFELSRHKQNSERAWQLQQWVQCGGVCVLGYEMFRNLSADNNKKFKKKMLKTFQEALVEPGPDLVVCDEGHLLKNEKTSLSQSMNRVRTLRRIVLTGTPLQNNLKEYYCMVQFVKPNLLGKYNEYLNRFVNPITNGQYTDSTERDISIMKRRSHVLHTMLDGAVQRRDYGVLAPFLPPKHEFVLFITLTDIQIKLYQHYLDNYSRRPLPGKSSGFLFPDFQSLQRIWTHPLVLKYNSERYEIMQQKKRDKEEEDSEGSIADFIDDDSTPEESSTEESSDDLSDASDDSRKKSKKKKSAKKGKSKDSKATARRGTRANPIEMTEEDKPTSDIEEVKYENPTEWWMKLVTDEELEDIRHSHKLLLLFDILRQCEAIGDKLLVFSQSLYSLDLIEHFLGKVDEATQEARIDDKLAGHVGSWSPGVDYFRLDGSTSCENRSIWCKNFNREDNPRARLFLISTRAGGLGINLVAANRVVIFDVSWNPSHDVQSIFRVYRFGQKKPCYIYRFLAMGTMEEKIYERQVTKQAISKRVIDEQQIDRHYAANDLAELYKFEPEPPEPRPVPSLPKDRLFAEMLKDHEKQIYRFHEHDSLLENKEEETLSEEERKRAWEEFENEKRAPPPAPFPSAWTMQNGMAASLMQQQQLAYTALAAMIRKDMPNINDNQLRDMLPIICNANPGMFGGYDYGLMQKMSEIYKYAAQPGLINPSMMNPVMNPASGMSTSSSLQYEPPWQRQQQQQQQMRLQQLMQQQQHSMGAKYYAGGLGSRDPVAMALQQQRAREILMGGGGAAGGGGGGGAPPPAGARPRGRPPLQPRAPAAADVVNLADSD